MGKGARRRGSVLECARSSAALLQQAQRTSALSHWTGRWDDRRILSGGSFLSRIFLSVVAPAQRTSALDAAKATAKLGNTESAYNQVWHLPTASNPLTGKEWIDSIATGMGVEPKYQVVTKFQAKTLGIFLPVMGELSEMMYQYDRDYIFDSSKIEKAFDFTPTTYQNGIEEIINRDYK